MTEQNDSFDFSMSLDATPQAKSTEPPKRYMAPPFRGHPINAEAVLIQPQGQYPPQQINAQLAQLLGLCNELRDMDGHRRHIAKTLGLSSKHAGAVQEGLEHLKDRGLLIPESTLLQGLSVTAGQDAPAPALGHCFIRTCDRPDNLSQLLASLQHTLSGGPDLTIWVLDDSKQASSVSINRTAIDAFAAQWTGNVHHVDIDRRRALIKLIAERAGADHDWLHWLIEGDEHDPEPTYGASLNTALLLAAGQRLCILDDDATLSPFGLPDGHASIHIQADRHQKTAFVDPDQPEASQFPTLTVNPVALHAQWLGQSLANVVASQAPRHPELLSRIDAQTLHELSGDPVIRLTTNGTLGDPGTSAMTWLFGLPADELSAICHQDAAWKNRLFNRRFARSSLGTQITTDFHLMTTTLTGIDNRVMLLPTAAKGRNEDLLFGVLIRFLYPDAMCAQLPMMLPHRPEDKRSWTEDNLSVDPSLHKRHGVIRVLCDWISTLDMSKGHHATRLAYLKACLEHLANLNSQTLKAQLLNQLAELQAAQLKDINETAAEADPPAWLKPLFTQVAEQMAGVDEHAEAHLEALAGDLQTFAKRYAQALDSWTQSWRWCCQHDMAEHLN